MSTFVTNFDVGSDNVLVRDPQIMHYEGLVNAKFPPDGMTAAVGDGTQNDTNAINALITFCINNNYALYFPAGVYLISPITISEKISMIGSNATIRLRPIMNSPLITLTGEMNATGIIFDGNIAGQTTIRDVISINGGSFKLNECVITGGKSCIIGSIEGDCVIYDSELSNYSEYGLYLNGNGRIISTGVDIPNVATGGALRFIRLDVSNSYIDAWESIAEVAVGVEITGDNNYISASFPNVETPVNDEGQNNNWEIIGESEKRFFNGTAYHQYENFQEKVSGDKTEEIGDKTETITTKTENVQNYSQTVTNFTGSASEKYKFSGEDIELNPTNPLTYKTPSVLNEFFNSIKMKDTSGEEYDVLVPGQDFDKIGLSSTAVNVKDYGAVGDGVTNDLPAINEARAQAISEGIPLYFPAGTYLINSSILGWDGMVLLGDNKYTTIILMQDSVNEPCVEFEQNAEKLEYDSIIVRNICFDQNKATYTPKFTAGAHAFRMTGFNGLVISDCRFINASGYGLGLQGRPDSPNPIFRGDQRQCWITGCDFYNNGRADLSSGNSDGCDIKLVRYMFMENCEAWNNSDSGIDVRAERSIINNVICRSNSSHGLHVRTPSMCILNNVFTEGNAMCGVMCFVGDGYEGSSAELVMQISNVYSIANGQEAISVGGGTEEVYTLLIDIDHVVSLNTPGAMNIVAYDGGILKVSNCNFSGTKANAGIINAMANAVFTNIRLNRFTIGYSGETTATGCTLALADNRATTPISGTSPNVLYPIFPTS